MTPGAVPANLASMIEHHPADAVALIEGDVEVTYGELRDRVARWRQRLTLAGIGPDSRVVIAIGNEIAFVETLFAVLGIGAVAAPINPYSPAAEARRKVDALNPDLVLIGETAVKLRVPDAFAHPTLVVDSVIDLAASPSGETDSPPIAAVSEAATAVLLSTSGVSGIAKVAMLTHGALAWVQKSLCGDGAQQNTAADRTLVVLPVAHVLGLNVALLTALRAGGTAVLQRRFDPEQSLELIRTLGITIVVGAPPMWHRWATGETGDADAMATVRFARSGAAALRPVTVERLRNRFGITVNQGYGLTETSSVVTTGRGVHAPATSVGRPLPGIAVVIVGADGNPVDIGDVGEVVVRTPGSFAGYLDDPESTDMMLTHDGWLWTGDLGVLDDDGFLHLVDRVKDIIIVSGFNVYPAEVEDVILGFPGVRAAVVVGAAHGMTGETVVAHVSGDIDVDELDAWVRTQLSTYKCPTSYYLVDDVPQTAAGKRVRRELRS